MPIVNWLFDTCATEIAQVLELMAAQQFNVTCVAGSTGLDRNAAWWHQPLSIVPDAPLSFGASAETWREIGTRVLQAAGVDTVDEAEARSTYFEILQQACNGVASAVGGKTGKTVECLPGAEKAADRSNVSEGTIAISGPGWSATVALLVPDAFLSAFSPTPPVPVAAAPAPSNVARPVLASKTVEVLLDVELPVSVSFGHTTLLLKDVLKLSPGSVMELNRLPEEPVEIVVNGHVIARGEVVVVDGNYGVRIEEIVSRQQRLSLERY